MTVMPSLRLSVEDAQDIATYLMSEKKQEPTAYAQASFMEDAELKEEGKKWIRQYGCAGCHEIAGFEDEGRIGTELTRQKGIVPVGHCVTVGGTGLGYAGVVMSYWIHR